MFRYFGGYILIYIYFGVIYLGRERGGGLFPPRPLCEWRNGSTEYVVLVTFNRNGRSRWGRWGRRWCCHFFLWCMIFGIDDSVVTLYYLVHSVAHFAILQPRVKEHLLHRVSLFRIRDQHALYLRSRKIIVFFCSCNIGNKIWSISSSFEGFWLQNIPFFLHFQSLSFYNISILFCFLIKEALLP